MVSLAEYRALQAQQPAKRGNPELDFQKRAARGVRLILPTPVLMTASAAGVRLPPKLARDLQEAGQSRGWPDWQFLFPDRLTRYIELKWQASLSPAQREFRDVAEEMGIWAVARSWDEIFAALKRWCDETGLPLQDLKPLDRARFGL